MSFIEIIFWASALLVVYIYIGYPVMLFMLSRLRKAGVAKNKDYLPNVTVLIAAYNEEQHIGETIRNKLAQDYPKDKLEIIAISDESEDRTDSIVTELSEQHPEQVKLLRQVPRNGKTAALNMAIACAEGDVVIFSDANSIYDNNAIRKLVENFSDSQVGYVTGRMIYVKEDGAVFGDGCSAYMKYENRLRSMETDMGSIVGVDGGIDAVRKELYAPMRADQIPDFVLPLNVIAQGYRVVYDPSAILKEQVLDDEKDEFRMRVRVGLRSLWAIRDNAHLFNPFKYPIFSWQLLSHKLLRYLAFIPLLGAFIANAALLSEGHIYVAAFVGQVAFYLLALIGGMKNRSINSVFVTLPYYFVLINVATSYAFFKFMKGDKQKLWNPRVG